MNCHWEPLSWMHYRRLADGQPSFSRLATSQAWGHWSQCLIMATSICGTLTHESAPCGDTQAQILPCFVPIKGALVGTEVLAESFSWCVALIGVMVNWETIDYMWMAAMQIVGWVTHWAWKEVAKQRKFTKTTHWTIPHRKVTWISYGCNLAIIR